MYGPVRAPAPGRLVGSRLKECTRCFLAGCCKRQLNQALSVLSLSLGFFWVCFWLFTRATFCVALFCVCFCSVSWLIWLGCQYQCKWLTCKTRLRNDLKCVDGHIKPYSLTHSLMCVCVFVCVWVLSLYGPNTWNSLPPTFWNIDSHPAFRRAP